MSVLVAAPEIMRRRMRLLLRFIGSLRVPAVHLNMLVRIIFTPVSYVRV